MSHSAEETAHHINPSLILFLLPSCINFVPFPFSSFYPALQNPPLRNPPRARLRGGARSQPAPNTGGCAGAKFPNSISRLAALRWRRRLICWRMTPQMSMMNIPKRMPAQKVSEWDKYMAVWYWWLVLGLIGCLFVCEVWWDDEMVSFWLSWKLSRRVGNCRLDGG
jgi:hypothetical protein